MWGQPPSAVRRSEAPLVRALSLPSRTYRRQRFHYANSCALDGNLPPMAYYYPD